MNSFLCLIALYRITGLDPVFIICLASSGSTQHSLCESTRDGRVNPPVSCPPRTLQILLHDFEQHKLSTIEEVDTPVNVTMDTGVHS